MTDMLNVGCVGKSLIDGSVILAHKIDQFVSERIGPVGSFTRLVHTLIDTVEKEITENEYR